MIFKHVCKKGNKFLARIEYDDKGDKWATTTKAVHDWAKKNFEEGDEVDVEYNIKNGQYFVTRISVPGKGSKKTDATQSDKNPTCADCDKELKDDKYKKCYTCNKKSPSNPTCSDCGKTLKDDKYEKCYTCNQKKPSKKSPETQEAIARQNANHATSRALIALQGQIDINNIYEISTQLHAHFLRLAKKE